jgi:hypothetical protein
MGGAGRQQKTRRENRAGARTAVGFFHYSIWKASSSAFR